MSRTVVEYRCLLMSPGDVAAEREALIEVVDLWNAQVGKALGCRLELVRWETHSTPDAGGEPQGVINQQIVDDCDFGVAIFWARLGTPTPAYPSGSVEEVERLLSRGARVLMYFSNAPIPQTALKDEQYDALQRFKGEMRTRALLGEYNDIADLRQQVTLHLTSVVSGLLERDRGQPDPSSTAASAEVLTAPKPDVRVTVTAVLTFPAPVQQYLRVSVQNHSPVAVFIAGLSVLLTNGRGLYPPRDAATGESQRRRRLEPGESYDFFLDPAELLKDVPVQDLDYVSVTDDVGRQYRSTTEELRQQAAEASKPLDPKLTTTKRRG